jgi:universal stress protein E
MVDEGRSIADALAGSLDVFHVLQTPPHLPGELVSSEHKAVAHARVRSIIEGLAYRASGYVRFAEGSTAAGLERLVEQHAPDILIMGAVARPRWVHSAASGTAAQMLERIGCDLLILKPPGFVSPLLVTDD